MIRLHKITAYLFLVLAFPLIIAGCDTKEDPYQAPPDDTKPSIRRLQPQQPSALLLPNDGINLRYVMTDNQELARFELFETRLVNVRYTEGGAVTGDIVPGYEYTPFNSQTVTGNEKTIDYTYNVPGNLDVFTRIEIYAEVTDNKGNKDKIGPFIITVDFTRLDPLAEDFSILSYEGDKIYNNMSVSRASGFNLVARKVSNADNYNNVAAKDIQENTSVAAQFNRQFISPNNGEEAVFVVLKPNQFNFDNLTYATMKNAFFSNIATKTTPTLEEGDVVILKMSLLHQTYTGAFKNHFAAIRIGACGPTPGSCDPVGDDDYLNFDYKRSQDVIK